MEYAASRQDGTRELRARIASATATRPGGHASPPPATALKQDAPRFSHYVRQPLERLVPNIFGLGLIGVIAAGWLTRGEQFLTPEEGAGYWLGITGATMMLLLLLYPLRKRIRLLRAAGSVRVWFQLHMLLGILGPTLILFHANFRLSSANATMATIAMLTVVASGLVGRYLYSRIHMGLYGRKAEAQEILDDITALEDALGNETGDEQSFAAELKSLDSLLPSADAGAMASFSAMMRLKSQAGVTTRRLSRRAQALIRDRARLEGWTRQQRSGAIAVARKKLSLYRAALEKAAALTFYTRLFALWHVLHLPLFIMLIVTATLHVIAVHLY